MNLALADRRVSPGSGCGRRIVAAIAPCHDRRLRDSGRDVGGQRARISFVVLFRDQPTGTGLRGPLPASGHRACRISDPLSGPAVPPRGRHSSDGRDRLDDVAAVVYPVWGLACSEPRNAARRLLAIPVVWSANGGSASVLLGVRADLGLIVAVFVAATYIAASRDKRGGLAEGRAGRTQVGSTSP